jgi:hypothetical protein
MIYFFLMRTVPEEEWEEKRKEGGKNG